MMIYNTPIRGMYMNIVLIYTRLRPSQNAIVLTASDDGTCFGLADKPIKLYNKVLHEIGPVRSIMFQPS